MFKKKYRRTGTIASSIVSAIILVFAVLLFLNRQYVADTLIVWQFQPSEQIVTVGERSGMTEKGQFAFYASQPQIATSESFNTSCPRREQNSPILGCYTNMGRIFIYDITNEKLDGIEEVTAVHEMLHAIWYRLSDSERQRLANLLETAYKNIEDPDLHSRMEYYQRTEPGEFANELHAILASEYPALGDELEKHYAQYFNREVLLAHHENYRSAYRQLTNEANALQGELEGLAKSIEQRSASYREENAKLSADIGVFNQRANTGAFTSNAQFNRERATLVARTSELESMRQKVNADIEQHNAAYLKYKQVATQLQSLNDSLDSFRELDKAPEL